MRLPERFLPGRMRQELEEFIRNLKIEDAPPIDDEMLVESEHNPMVAAYKIRLEMYESALKTGS